jgi:hypothetical protein
MVVTSNKYKVLAYHCLTGNLLLVTGALPVTNKAFEHVIGRLFYNGVRFNKIIALIKKGNKITILHYGYMFLYS